MSHRWLPPAAPGSAGHDALLKHHREWGWHTSNRQLCRAKTRKGVRCSAPVLAGFDLCLRHAGPVGSRVRRERELREFAAGRITPEQWARSEARRVRNRIGNQRRYRDSWFKPGLTLAFVPALEAKFQESARALLGGLTWDDLPDRTRDRLRWAWRRYQLDRDRSEAWRAKAHAALVELAARGPLPDAIEHDDGTGAHVIVVERRPTGFSRRTRMTETEVERARASPRQLRMGSAGPRRGAERQAAASGAQPLSIDVDGFLGHQGRDLRGVLGLVNSDDDLRAVVLARSAVIDGTPGAHDAWVRLLRQLRSTDC